MKKVKSRCDRGEDNGNNTKYSEDVILELKRIRESDRSCIKSGRQSRFNYVSKRNEDVKKADRGIGCAVMKQKRVSKNTKKRQGDTMAYA